MRDAPKRRAGIGVHLLLLAALLPVVADAPPPASNPPVVVTLIPPETMVAPPAPKTGQDPGASSPAPIPAEAEKLTPPKAPEPAAPLPALKPVPAPVRHRPALTPPPTAHTVVAAAAPAPVSTVGQIAVLGEAQLAGALTAGAGQGAETGVGRGDGSGVGAGSASGAGRGTGDRCDMVQRLQTVLRRNPEIRAVAAQAHSSLSEGRPSSDRGALLVWNGDWLRNPGQEGKGLAGLRQAIAVEIAFAPAVCREQTVEGLVLIRLGDTPDDPRLALGAGRWRWSDLLGL